MDVSVEEVVARVLDTGCTPEEACQHSPGLLDEVRARLRWIGSVDRVVDDLFPEVQDLAHDGAAGGEHDHDGLPDVPGHVLLSVLGHGGMGIVYAARHLRLNRVVALKMLLGGAHTDRAGVRRFLREAEAVAALRHPNIVQVYEVGDDAGLPYFTMELVEGGSLRERLALGALDPREAAALVATLAEATEAAHATGIVHRDLKPANVLLTHDGVPKIVDFGLARRIADDSSLTLTDARLGTPSYMAPEQARGGSVIGPAADVYGLGAILYAAVTGEAPFRGASCAATLRQVLEDEPVRPTRRNRHVPRDLETICLKCLGKEPLRRYGSAGALAADLRSFLHGEPIHARPAGMLERGSKWVRRRPAHATVVAGALLAAFSIAAVAVWLRVERETIRRAVHADLRDVDRAALVADWPAARTALERARARLATGGPSGLSTVVDEAARELDLVDRLETIRIEQASAAYGKFDRARNRAAADLAYTRIFDELGLAELTPHEVAALLQGSRIHSVLVATLDWWANCVSDDAPRRERLSAIARLADPDPTGWRDRVRDPATWSDLPALSELTATASLSDESVMLLLALAERVIFAGGDAVPFLEQIQGEHPGDYWSNFTLGLVHSSKRPEHAIRYYQAALSLRTDSAVTRVNLGAALGATGRIDEAASQFQRAIGIDPEHGIAHANLGRCLVAQGRHAEAVASIVEAKRLDAGAVSTMLRCNLGGSLLELGRVDEAIDELREAVELEPGSSSAHYGLGFALHVAGQLEEAEARLRQSAALDPRSAPTHESLGRVLEATGRLSDAILSYREAARLDTKRNAPHRALIDALLAGGRREEACTEARVLLERCAASDPGHMSLQALVEHCERVITLHERLPTLSDDGHGVAEHLALAAVFRGNGDPAAATRHFVDAERLGEGTPNWGRDFRPFDAARCAAEAGALGEFVSDLETESERRALRVQALNWLREEVDALTALLAQPARGARPNVLIQLADWRADPALAGVRDEAFLARLAEDEQAEWHALWREVDALARSARSTP